MHNGFSPDGDGINDTWVIKNIDHYPYSKTIVVNRWGSLVFDKINYKNDWDGIANVNQSNSSDKSDGGNGLPTFRFILFLTLLIKDSINKPFPLFLFSKEGRVPPNI